MSRSCSAWHPRGLFLRLRFEGCGHGGHVSATDPLPVASWPSQWPCCMLPCRDRASFGDRNLLGTSCSFPSGWFSELKPHLGRFSAPSSGPLWPLQLLSSLTQPNSFLGGHFLGKPRPDPCCGWLRWGQGTMGVVFPILFSAAR